MTKIGIIDIETTGFFKRGGLIVEVGIASLDVETGEVEGVYTSVVQEPGLKDSDAHAWIFSNSDLSFSDVTQAPSLDSQRAQIQACINSFEGGVTAYNKEFDFTFLRDRGIIIDKELPCPMKIATPVCKLPSTGYGDYKRPKVEEAWDYFIGTPYVEKHRGLDDAVHEAKIVYELYKSGDFVLS